jgi:sugar phosphate isomerase/epimerase
MRMDNQRRIFLKQLAGYTALGTTPSLWCACNGPNSANGGEQADSTASVASTEATPKPLFFTISLAEWSLNKMLFGKQLDNLQFPVKAKNDFGIDAVEYVSAFFADKAKDSQYLAELKKICDDNGVASVLIMVDNEGGLGDTNAKERQKAVENHYKWVEAAKFLGCHSIRVNAYGQGTAEEVAKAAIDGLGKLTEFGMKENMGVIVENHGGYSSDGKWLAGVIGAVNQQLNTKLCGTLPDFGNFCLKYKNDDWQQGCEQEYDRYVGTTELMPYARGVSAKSHEFDENGNETAKDYVRLLQIVKDAGYTGRIGIEYEGSKLSEEEGIKATKRLLERAGGMVA